MKPKDLNLIEIPKEKYDEMLKRIAWLECLEAAGVDNWQGIDEAHKMLEESEDE